MAIKDLALKKETSQSLATTLYQVQEEIAELKDREDGLKRALLENLKKQGVKSLHLEDGTHFTVAHRETLKPKNLEKAMEWAKENNVLSIDMKKARELLRRSLKLPSFFKVEKGEEYLIIKRA